VEKIIVSLYKYIFYANQLNCHFYMARLNLNWVQLLDMYWRIDDLYTYRLDMEL
jgi:hypothetical protein